MLEEYLKQHNCPVPRCLCDAPARFQRLRAAPNTDKIGLLCGVGRDCRFFQVIDDLLLSPDISYHCYEDDNSKHF